MVGPVGLMDGFQRRREQKKESIRRAALDLFGVHGIKKVSVNDVARRAGVSPVTIYNYYGSKQGLVHDAARWVLTAPEDDYAAIIGSRPRCRSGSRPLDRRCRRALA